MCKITISKLHTMLPSHDWILRNVFLLFCNLNSKSYKNKFSKIKKAYAKDSWKRHETGALRLMKWLFASLMLLWLLDGRISHTWFYALKMFIWVHSYIHTWKIKLFPHGLPLGIRIPFNFEKAPFHVLMFNMFFTISMQM